MKRMTPRLCRSDHATTANSAYRNLTTMCCDPTNNGPPNRTTATINSA